MNELRKGALGDHSERLFGKSGSVPGPLEKKPWRREIEENSDSLLKWAERTEEGVLLLNRILGYKGGDRELEQTLRELDERLTEIEREGNNPM